MIKKEVMLPKETSELADALVKLLAGVKGALADGFQPGQDIPEVIMLAVHELGAAMVGIDKVPGEIAEKKAAASKALALAAIEMVEVLSASAPVSA